MAKLVKRLKVMKTRLISCLLIFVTISFLSLSLEANNFFKNNIEPLLQTHCFECHSHGKKIKAGLALDSKSGWQTGGDSGPAIVPGHPDKSLLIKMINWIDEDHQMPPKKKLSDDDIQLLEKWVNEGAEDPRQLDLEIDDPLEWWSLKPLSRSDVPDGTHPVDFFIEKKLKEEGINSVHRADPRTLVRRLYFDLHGMLPLPQQNLAPP